MHTGSSDAAQGCVLVVVISAEVVGEQSWVVTLQCVRVVVEEGHFATDVVAVVVDVAAAAFAPLR